ncbi:amino acid adenylation domain-containing protein [Streptomyces caniscabiei]|uniref:Amino acid adenylation domain-containing protein n=1 Tax=Streptomyces caniscabiei TaxID=2746961 RepID=A0A927L4H0_9ACTN|nr:amino acid adenylation domain-containing protein [Streptomyces caniscabiei]MBD9725900.1 amino acid adenylation domain-containing protein [Streptomyces caniscabiei]MDX3507618.1 amino acid adenylation domain-containing protein [Streptomyces caniscabiei]MDX3717580.1 amino acid adenylation domain-containing protein [Streptomyces caniscabiei]WEO25332.1 amino acid adenylation domain-containing protein [Streptomyces caniscabiei]
MTAAGIESAYVLKPSTFVPFIAPVGAWDEYATPETLTVPLLGTVVQRLHEMAGELSVSEAAILLAAWRSLYARYTQNRDDQVLVVADDPVSMRLPLSPSAPFTDVVKASDTELRAATETRSRTGTVGAAAADADLDRGPVLSFRFRHGPADSSAGQDALSSVDVPGVLHMHCDRETERLRLTLAGTHGRVTKSDLVLIAEAFEQLLTDALAEPDRAVGVLRLCPPRAAAAPRHGRYESVLHRFLEHAECHPGRPAVRCGDEVLSYEELRDRAAAVAALLDKRGVRAGDNVAVLAMASQDTLAAMLGTWMAGAAFVPFDAAWPAERIASVLRQAAPPLALVPGAAMVADLAVPTASVPAAVGTGRPEGPAPNSADAEGTAYTIFTSGTSGTPRGVVIGHAQLAHYASAVLNELRLPEGAEFAAVSTLASDLSYTAIFPTLAAGGCVRLLDLDDATSPRALAERLRAHPVAAMKLVPSHLRALLDEASDPAELLPQEALVLGGELLPRSLRDRLRELAPQLRVYNHYGPTETTIGASCLTLDAAPDERCASLPVGTGLGENVLTVVDDENNPLPPWCPGEVLITGPGVGIGYLSELCAGRSGFAERGTSGSYRTGDLGRLVPGVGVEIIGRLDDQVKLHGYRVQLREIESLLNQQSGVSTSAVIARADDSGLVSHLDAYLVGAGHPSGGTLSLPDVQAALGRRLPAAMMPTGWQILERLPLTPTGKVDREALSPVETRQTRVGRPRDSVEQRLLALWASVLETDALAPEDDFFESGGHSLRAIKLISLVNNAFGCTLPMSSIFSARTVAAMASLIRTSERHDSNLVPLRGARGGKPVFCLHAGGGNTLSYWELARLLPDGVQVIGVESWGLHGREPQENYTEMVEEYAAAIAAESQEPPVLIGWCFGGAMAFETAQALRRAGTEVDRLILIDSSVPGTDGEESDDAAQEPTLISRFAWHYELGLPEETVDALTYEDLLSTMQNKGHLPPDAGEDELRTLLAVYTSNMTASERHFEKEPEFRTPDFPVTLVRAEPSGEPLDRDRTWGWSNVVGQDLDFASADADHHSIMREPAVSELAGHIGQVLK